MFGRKKHLSDAAGGPGELAIFKRAAEDALDQIVVVDANGTIVYANAAAEQTTGYSKKELLGKEVGAVGLWGGQTDQALYATIWDTVKNKKQVFAAEIEGRRKDEAVYDIAVRIIPFTDEAGEPTFFISIGRDITAEKELRRRRDELELFFNVSVDIFCIVDAEGLFQRVNPAFERALGWSEADLIGKLIITFVYIDDREATLKELEKLRTGKITTHFKSRFHRKDGGYSWVGWTATPMPDGTFYATLRDITQEERIDRAKTEFVSLASHQLRTPLTSIKWYAALLLKGNDGPLNSLQRQYLTQIYEGNERMIELVAALLNTSRIDMGTVKLNIAKVDPAVLTRQAVEEQRQQANAKKIALDVNLGADIPAIETDKKILYMLFQNLLSNAIGYTPEGGSVRFRVARAVAGSTFGGQPVDADGITVEVADTGIGIPEDQQAEIFKKLFRARNAVTGRSGTGLGLYIVRSFIELAGGRIWFRSKENKGTTFFVTLPMRAPEGVKVV